MRSVVVFALAIMMQLGSNSVRLVAQQLEKEPKTWAWIEIKLRSPGRAEASFYLHPSPRDSTPIMNEIKQALGCQSLESAKSALEEEEEEAIESEETWSRDLWCNGIMLRKGLAASGVFDPAPLLDEARARGLDSLDVLIYYYGPMTLSLQAPPSWSKGSVYGRYLVPISTLPGSTMRMRLGYPPADVAKMILLAFALQLLPLSFILFIRRVLLREAGAAEPALGWFGYWRFLQWNMLGPFMLWFTTISFLKFGSFLRFVLGIDSENRTTVLQAVCYAILIFLPPMIVNIICTDAYYPVLRRLRDVHWSKPQVFQQALWTQIATLVPMALIVAAFGLLSGLNLKLVALTLLAALLTRIIGVRRRLTVTDHLVPAALTVAALSLLPGLGLELAAVCGFGALVAALLTWILRVRRLLTINCEPYALSSGELRDRAFSLAEKAHVKLKKLYVLPTTNEPTANAYARGGKTIVLTDYLLEHLSRREVDALLAHELAHLRRRHPVLPLIPFIVAFWAAYFNASLEGDVPLLPKGNILPLCIVIGLVMYFLLTRYFERAADAAAVKLTSDSESLISALSKLNTLNRMPLRWGTFQSLLITYPSILRCVHRVARRTATPEDRLAHILESSEADSDRYRVPTPDTRSKATVGF